jgi:hypothetical protein
LVVEFWVKNVVMVCMRLVSETEQVICYYIVSFHVKKNIAAVLDCVSYIARSTDSSEKDMDAMGIPCFLFSIRN